MKTNPHSLVHAILLTSALTTAALAAGPYPPTGWPPTVDPTKIVHYAVTDADAGFTPPNGNWTDSLLWASSGDQAYVAQQVCGPLVNFTGNKATSTYINIADRDWEFWNTQPHIDILVQVYGDESLMIQPANTNTRVWRFREGTSGTYVCEAGGATQTKTVNGAPIPTNNLPNFKWNWLLFSITNEPVIICGTDSGNRWVGSVNPNNYTGNKNYGGVNGGTIRMQPQSPSAWSGLIIHAMAWGEAGAFGDPADINQFEPADGTSCDPVPDQNLVGIDFNAGVANYLQVMNDLDQTVTYVASAGPAGDLRKAVIPNGAYLNFGILGNRLGRPCNPNVAMKICVDFYDDPALAGAMFGPESHAADQYGGSCAPNVAVPATAFYTLQGTGKWIRKSWTLPGVNLFGVNTEPLTGGPRFISANGQVAVSRFELAALRMTGPLAGQDPLADCRPDPEVCTDAYGIYAELDLNASVTNGLDLGNNGGDQTYIVETAGPPDDLRTSVRNADGTSQYLNFALVGDPMGPVSQGNCRLAIAVTYYDDPQLAGMGLRPQTWRYESGGTLVQGFLNAPQDNIILQGSNKWRDAYWEIGRITFNGVNQSPAAARFQADFGTDTTKKIHISRVRYAVIRDCGPNAGVNQLAPDFTPVRMNAAPAGDGLLTKLSWPYQAPQAQVQGVSTLGSAWANDPTFDRGVPTVEGGDTRFFYVTNSSAASQFFRLIIPQVP